MARKEIIVFLLIFLTGSFLRLWQLSKNPPGLHYDEASFAYNAYCLLKTGRDEFGNFLPVNIRAFDDWRPPVYTYLTTASFSFFGVNDFAVRLPSSLAGIALIAVFYFFVRDFVGPKIALLAGFLISLNPTLIMFSRAAYDSNMSLTFTILVFWLFWKGVRKKKVIWLIGCLFFAVISVLTYQASKVFVPLLLLVFVFVYWKELVKIFSIGKNFLILLLFGFICGLPVWLSSSQSTSLFRFRSISVFAQEEILKSSINRLILNQKLGWEVFNPLANRRLLFFQEILVRYLDNFNPSFLFAPKMQPSMHYIPNFGSFLWFEIVFFLMGIFVIGRKLDKGKKIILASWFFLVALPTAPLSTAPYITRILPIIPVTLLVVSFGLAKIWSLEKAKRIWLSFPSTSEESRQLAGHLGGVLRLIANGGLYFVGGEYGPFYGPMKPPQKTDEQPRQTPPFHRRGGRHRLRALIIVSYSLSLLYLAYSLFILLPVENGKVWQAGYREMVEQAYQLKDKYKKIYVSNSLERPYIFFLWHGRYEPILYQPHGAKRGGSGLSPEVEFENFSFRQFSPEIFEKEENNLYIGKPQDFPKQVEILEEIGCGEKERQECIWFVTF